MNTSFDWHSEASKSSQESKIASLQNTISRLTEANKHLEKDKRASEVFPHLSFPLSPNTLQCPGAHPGAVTHLPFGTTSSSSRLSRFPSSDSFGELLFPEPLPLPVPLNLSESVPLKLTLLRLQINPQFLMFPGLRPNCEPWLRSFLK